jgi:hypothetical protein
MRQDEFYPIIKRFGNLMDRPVKKEQAEELYESLKYESAQDVRAAIEQMITDESKLTLGTIKKNIAAGKHLHGEARSGSHWNGAPCDNCSMGLINTIRKINSYSYSFVYRCPKCKSYDAPSIPFYNGDGYEETRKDLI